WEVVMLLVGSTVAVEPDQQVHVTRDTLARWAGLRRDRLGWITDYLEEIGCLRTHRGVRTRNGQTRDRFSISTAPPQGYDGPRSLVALDLELADKSPGQSPEPTSGVRGADPGTHYSVPGSESPGQSPEPTSGVRGADPGTHYSVPGSESPGQSPEPTSGFPHARVDRVDLSSSGGEEREIEPVPGGTAEPPATGQEAAMSAGALELARRLPWAEWSRRTGRALPSAKDVQDIAMAIDTAVHSAEITLDQAAEIGCRVLATADTPRFVVGAFARHLTKWLPAAVADEADQLPMPAVDEAASAESSEAITPATREPHRPECRVCGAEE